jgi:plasmid stabilization system protein ParE
MPRRILLSRRVRNWVDIETEYLAVRSATAAGRLRERIASAQRLLADFPHVGTQGDAVGTRRFVITPYVLTYREVGPDVGIVGIRHSRQAERPIPDER